MRTIPVKRDRTDWAADIDGLTPARKDEENDNDAIRNERAANGTSSIIQLIAIDVGHRSHRLPCESTPPARII